MQMNLDDKKEHGLDELLDKTNFLLKHLKYVIETAIKDKSYNYRNPIKSVSIEKLITISTYQSIDEIIRNIKHPYSKKIEKEYLIDILDSYIGRLHNLIEEYKNIKDNSKIYDLENKTKSLLIEISIYFILPIMEKLTKNLIYNISYKVRKIKSIPDYLTKEYKESVDGLINYIKEIFEIKDIEPLHNLLNEDNLKKPEKTKEIVEKLNKRLYKFSLTKIFKIYYKIVNDSEKLNNYLFELFYISNLRGIRLLYIHLSKLFSEYAKYI